MISVLAKASPDQSGSREKIILNPLALYEGGLPTFTEGYDEKHRVYIYWALEEVTQRLHIDAIYTGKKPLILNDNTFISLSTLFLLGDQALGYLKGVEDLERKEMDEFLWLLDSQIAILVKENEMRQALEKIKLRIDLMSRFRGDEFHEMAKELMRMSCFFSLKGEHNEAKTLLEQSLKVIKSTSGGDVRREIDLVKILATTYDVIGNTDEAIKFYNIAIALRKKTKREIDDPAKFLLESCALLVSFVTDFFRLCGCCSLICL
jgi:tetratricopeptide (TPR) repeat protein